MATRSSRTKIASLVLAAFSLSAVACDPPGLPFRPTRPNPTAAPATTSTSPTTTSPTTSSPTTEGPTTTAPTTEAPTTEAPTTTAAPTTAAPTTSSVSNPLIEGLDDTPPSATWTKPAVGLTYLDPVYGTEIRRVTSAEGTRFDRNTYSRRQAENADGTMFYTYHGEAKYRIYDRATTDLVAVSPLHPGAEPQWHPTDSSVIRHVLGDNASVGDLRYYEYDIDTGNSVVVADLTARIQAQFPTAQFMIDRYEGSPSADGTRSAWMIYDGTETPIGVVSYDLSTDTVLGLTSIGSLAPAGYGPTEAGPLDWVSASPTGDYMMAGFHEATVVYDADFSNPRLANDEGAHSDIALNANGRDSFVYIDFSAGPNGGWLMATDLDTMASTRLLYMWNDANTSIHISGKAYDTPGWVVMSTYNCSDPGAWSCTKVLAVQIQADPLVYNLAHTYNCGQDYWTETQAVANRDLSRIYFNSDGGSCGIDAEVYEISLDNSVFQD